MDQYNIDVYRKMSNRIFTLLNDCLSIAIQKNLSVDTILKDMDSTIRDMEDLKAQLSKE